MNGTSKFFLRREIEFVVAVLQATTIILLDTLNTSKEESQIIEEQAIGRLYRIGQNDSVVVNRIIMVKKNNKKTIDQRIIGVQDEKKMLINSLLL